MLSPIRRYLTTPHPAVVAVRVFLAAVFLLYGWIKLTGVQFVYDWQQETFTRGGTHGHTIIWYFFGYSRAYGTFVGLCEIVPALLLLWHRTARLATLMLFAVSTNIAVMDVCYGVPLPATVSVIVYALSCAALLWRDRSELAGGLFPPPL